MRFGTDLREWLSEYGGRDLQPHQIPPSPFERGWLLLAGRGSGKTFAVMRWLIDQAHATPGLRARIIGPTLDDVIESNVEGPSGLLQLDATATLRSTLGGARVEWPNGSRALLIGTPTRRDVDRLRAKTNSEIDIFEEIAANPWAADVVAQAALGRRVGVPRWVAATTPKPAHPVLAQWLATPGVHVSRATSHDNPHLPADWISNLGISEGTDLHRQEVMGEMLDEIAGALWTRSAIDATRVPDVGVELEAVAVGVDPAKSTGITGIVTVGRGTDGDLYVLADRSSTGTPDQWANVIAEEARRWDATVVVESDTGGLWIAQAIRASTGLDLPIKSPEARRAGTAGHVRGPKAGRAEPIAGLWMGSEPSAHIVGVLPALETQLTGWDGTGASPDRMDAMVWACHHLRVRRVVESSTNPALTSVTNNFGGVAW